MNTKYETIHVECYSSFKVNERPVAFTFQERRLEISEIMDRWYEGGIDARWTGISTPLSFFV
jgi:hypothetical protein